MNAATFSILKYAEGGMGFNFAKFLLEDAKVGPVKKVPTPYVGHVGIEVPKKFERKATKILYGK